MQRFAIVLATVFCTLLTGAPLVHAQDTSKTVELTTVDKIEGVGCDGCTLTIMPGDGHTIYITNIVFLVLIGENIENQFTAVYEEESQFVPRELGDDHIELMANLDAAIIRVKNIS